MALGGDLVVDQGEELPGVDLAEELLQRRRLASIDAVLQAARRARKDQDELAVRVRASRELGTSWARIGRVTGLSAEGARKRWGA